MLVLFLLSLLGAVTLYLLLCFLSIPWCKASIWLRDEKEKAWDFCTAPTWQRYTIAICFFIAVIALSLVSLFLPVYLFCLTHQLRWMLLYCIPVGVYMGIEIAFLW